MRLGKRVCVVLTSVVVLVSAGCSIPMLDLSEEAAAAVREQDLGTFPYHPVAYHLDLSIYIYQLYTQTLVWPFDPYYEEAGENRDALMARVRAWAVTTGSQQVSEGLGIDAYRGPGVLAGFEDNPAHDPIIYQYSRMHPWSDTLKFSSRWTEYQTPAEITGQIRDVWMCTRTTGSTQQDHQNGVEGTVTLYELPSRRPDAQDGARDILMAFEGGTGDKSEMGQPASQSLMGFALLRSTVGEDYDIHIAFRGSQAGSVSRAAREAISTDEAGGNPDWITDLGYLHVVRPLVSAQPGHEVSRGMSTSIASIVPQVFYCLDRVVGENRATPPSNIYLTGHSLGGALAQQFASVVLLGDHYGPGGDRMPASLQGWPWESLKLITFGAPRVGNRAWAEALTTESLQSQFYVPQSAPFDGDGIGITDLSIIPRLLDSARPAAYRVLIPSDPVSTGLFGGESHVGHTVYLEEGDALNIALHMDGAAHDTAEERARITDTLRDERIPATAVTHYPLEDLTPTRDASMAGTRPEYEKVISSIREYYTNANLFFDSDAFERSVMTFFDLLEVEGGAP